MPVVSGKHYAYTPKGMKAAHDAAMKSGKAMKTGGKTMSPRRKRQARVLGGGK